MAKELPVQEYQKLGANPAVERPNAPVNHAVGMFQRAFTALQTDLPQHTKQGHWNMLENSLREDFAGVVSGSGCVTLSGAPDYAQWFGLAIQSLPDENKVAFVDTVVTELSAEVGSSTDSTVGFEWFSERLAEHIVSIPDAAESRTTYEYVYDALVQYQTAKENTGGDGLNIQQAISTLVETVNSRAVVDAPTAD
jgi:hypothetical protein